MYYVLPTESPNSGCPGLPCEILDYYFCNGDRYFNSEKINVTLHGKHTVSGNYTDCGSLAPNLGYYTIYDLEKFEMIGTEPAHEVVVYLSTGIWLTNVTLSNFEMLTFVSNTSQSDLNNNVLIFLPGYDIHGTMSSSEITVKTKIFITKVKGVIFNSVLLYQYTTRPLNFTIHVLDTTFTNQSGLLGVSGADPDTDNYIRHLDVRKCTFSESSLYLYHVKVNILIYDTIFSGGTFNTITFAVYTVYSNVVIGGKVYVSSIGHSLTVNGKDSLSFLFTNVTIDGNVTFANNKRTPLSAYSSAVTVSGIISFLNNLGTNGGAIALYASTLNIARNTSLYFYSNTATETGGAIYVANINNKNILPRFSMKYTPCFYQLVDYDGGSWYDIQFVNNSAKNGGDHVYGESMHSDACYVASRGYKIEPIVIPTYCVQEVFEYHPRSISSVSSDPTRVCICVHGLPQCSDNNIIIAVHPGETFTLSAVVVGADLGTTVGTVHAIFDDLGTAESVVLKPSSQYVQGISNHKICTKLKYTIFSSNYYEMMYLTTKQESLITINKFIEAGYSYTCENQNGFISDDYRYISQQLVHTQLHISISLLPCPNGFILTESPSGCNYCPALSMFNVSCQFINGSEYHSWSGPMWIGIDDNPTMTVKIAMYCPLNYCNLDEKSINLQEEANLQCFSNREGQLCGGCNDSYSLAIGSSRCIQCPNSNNLALLIFFAAAGLMLVFFISILNLTVTQGMINGVIFYANIVWTYQNILFPQQGEINTNLAHFVVILRVFIAWVNLDFGIETCFINVLNAFWKTWLQYLFPFYIWSIAGIIIFFFFALDTPLC